MFGSKSHLVGLDIGSKTLKVAEVIEGKGNYRLKRFGMFDIETGAIQDGMIKKPDIVTEALQSLFKSSGIKETNVAISVGGYSVIVKKINVATMAEDKLQDTIQFEAEQYIPFDINDVNIDFQILGANEANPNQMSVLLVAAKKDMVTDYVNLINVAGLNPCIIDVESFALQNIYEFNYEPQEKSIALIDIGSTKTSLNIIKEFASVFMRDVSLGCNQINAKIAESLGCSTNEAEDLKLGLQPEKLPEADLNDIVSAVVGDWCTEIRRAFDFFYSTYPEESVSKIVLSGGGANIGEFKRLLGVETSAEVETIDPFKGFSIDDGLDESFLRQVAPQAAISLGLAIRRVDDK